MVKIISDTSTLFTIEEGKKIDVDIIPLSINIADQQLRDLDVDMEWFYEQIEEGNMPTSSQPPIGEVVEAYEAYQGEEILNITMAHGLSGTYESACSAKDHIHDNEKITVLNAKTLCGPHRYLVEKAAQLSKAGENLKNILENLKESINDTTSFLIPSDFKFLKRGGRLSPAAATIGGLLKIKPVVILSEDGTKLEKFGMFRTMSKALEEIISNFQASGVNEQCNIYVAHSICLDLANSIIKKLQEVFPNVNIELLELSPAFVTQGGPGCVAIQYIRK